MYKIIIPWIIVWAVLLLGAQRASLAERVSVEESALNRNAIHAELSETKQNQLFEELESFIYDPNKVFTERRILICSTAAKIYTVLYMSGGGYMNGYGVIAIYDDDFTDDCILFTDRILSIEHKSLTNEIEILLVKSLSGRGTGLRQESVSVLDLQNIQKKMWEDVLLKNVIGSVKKGCTAQQTASKIAFIDINHDGYQDILKFTARSYIPDKPYEIPDPLNLNLETYIFDSNKRVFLLSGLESTITWPQ